LIETTSGFHVPPLRLAEQLASPFLGHLHPFRPKKKRTAWGNGWNRRGVWKSPPPQPFSPLRWVLRLAISFQVKDDGCVHHDAGISVLAVELGKGTTNINIDPILCLVSCPHYDAYPNEHHLTSYPKKSRNGI